MSTFREQTTILSGLIALAGAGVFAWLLLKQKRKRWIYMLQQQALLAAGGLLVLAGPIATRLDQWMGLNNFSWWLGYSLGMGACINVTRQMGLASDKPFHRKVNRAVLWIGWLALAEMTVLYFSRIRANSEWLARTPRTHSELLFSLSFFFYGVLVSLHSFMPFWKSISREANPYVRFRIRLGNSTFVLALLCFTAKTLYLILAFYWGGFEWVNRIALTSMLLTTAFWFLSYLPLQWLPWLYESNPRHLYLRWRSLSDLEYLQNELSQLMTPVPSSEVMSTFARLRNLQRLTYRTTVAILDGKRYLDAYLETTPNSNQQNSIHQWTNEQWKLAHELHNRLQCVDSVVDGSLTEITAILGNVSKQMQRAKS